MRSLRSSAGVVRIGTRAFDILERLAVARGDVVTKEELMQHVWPHSIVEESNLAVHLSALRKILGDARHLIVTVPGRGYRLLGAASLDDSQAGASGDAEVIESGRPGRNARGALPDGKRVLFGRETALAEIGGLIGVEPLVTLIGAGGIGKTSLAVETARTLGARFRDGVACVELAGHTDRTTILNAVAEAFGVTYPGGVVTPARIAASAAGKSCLLVLDNAEHVIELAAELVDVLTATCRDVSILVTSREPLRVRNEYLYRVLPLDVPAPEAESQNVLAHPAVKLFFARARALEPRLGQDSQSIALVGDICRRLDGLPLAIELAAASAATLGIAALVSRLDDRLQLLTAGHRNAEPRHQTLRATFEWSYALLDARGQAMFRRLGVFVGSFELEGCLDVISDMPFTRAAAIDAVQDLINKSLVAVEFDGAASRFRLMESSRAFAWAKLVEEGEAHSAAARHIDYLRARFRHMYQDEAPRSEAERGVIRRHLHEARAALQRAFSQDGDPACGVELTSWMVEALFEFSLVEECFNRASLALDELQRMSQAQRERIGEKCRLRLLCAVASTRIYTRGPVSRSEALWTDALELATRLGHREYRERAIWGIWNTKIASSHITESYRYATQFNALVEHAGSAQSRSLATQMVAVSLHCLGEHTKASVLLASTLSLDPSDTLPEKRQRYRVAPDVSGQGTLARIYWLQGRPAEAQALVELTLERVQQNAREPSFSHVLATTAVPLALWSGHLARAGELLALLRKQADRNGFELWLEYCRALEGHLQVLSGHPERGLALLDSALGALAGRGFRRVVTPLVCAQAEALARVGLTARAKHVLDRTIAQCSETGEQLFLAEVWRTKGLVDWLTARDETHAEAIERLHASAAHCMMNAHRIAMTQGARMYQLRAALTLAQISRDTHAAGGALELLRAACAGIADRSCTSDIDDAWALLEAASLPARTTPAELSQAARPSYSPLSLVSR